ncbi:hypothetical protein, partial [Georgenia yuyongxinii]|uniref:hypothetical protein n=1 Tax=Georgenia yuyongxinii TaxID=2589797 RepID=UPI003AF762FA
VSPERAAAGAARGAGIVPGSTRAEELRRGREAPAGRSETMAAQDPEATVAMAAVNDGGTPEAAGVARGAGIVPASDRAAEFRRARGEDEHGPAAAGLRSDADMPAEDWTAGETGDLGAAAVPGGTAAVPGGAAAVPDETTGSDETEDGTSAPPSWRSLWGFGERKDDEGEEKR